MTGNEDELESLRAKTSTGDRLDEADGGDDASEEGRVDRRGREVNADSETTNADTAANSEKDTLNEGPSDSVTGEQDNLDADSGGTTSMSFDIEEYDADLVAAINEAFDDLERNDRGLHIWDGDLAALVAVLEEDADLKGDVIAALDEQTETTVEIESQSEFLSCALRVGLDEVAPELMSALREVKKRRVLREL